MVCFTTSSFKIPSASNSDSEDDDSVPTVLTPDEQALYKELEVVRKAKGTVGYKELFERAHVHWPGRRWGARMVGHCSEYANDHSRHLISVLVRNVNTGLPGGQIFGLGIGKAHKLKRKSGDNSPLTLKEIQFVNDETQRVYNDP